jgi:hypothetical protein
MEGRDVGVHAEVTQYQEFLLDLFNIICHILQDFYSHSVT